MPEQAEVFACAAETSGEPRDLPLQLEDAGDIIRWCRAEASLPEGVGLVGDAVPGEIGSRVGRTGNAPLHFATPGRRLGYACGYRLLGCAESGFDRSLLPSRREKPRFVTGTQ